MPDGREPANHTLELLREIRAEQKSSADIMGKIADAVAAVAATQQHHSELLKHVLEMQRSHGGRLNAIEGRLAIIERHTGLVEAQ